ncbi:MAG: MBL fold metallo-hydrolase [Parachlamydiales bacterium]|nr:MBL fold metallo-hydrolase [Parachlamydiales bacterium]
MGIYNKHDKKIILPKDFEYPSFKGEFTQDEPSVAWIGHCSFFIKTKKFNLLTDPIWNSACSPVSFIGPKRKHKPALDMHMLKKVDYVLISHDHYDHLDKKTVVSLNKIYPSITWIVPIGMKKWFFKNKITKNVYELDWWDLYLDDNIEVHAVPAQHYSGRGLFDGNKRLWCGYVIKSLLEKKNVYFTGDTGYNDILFKSIADTFKYMDLSLIPIGTYSPRKFMSPVHIDPYHAVKIHKDVKSKLSIGMHWKTFQLSNESLDLPPYELFLNLQKENIDLSEFVLLQPGDFINW